MRSRKPWRGCRTVAAPERARKYVMWLETACDHAGVHRENFVLRENIAALERMQPLYAPFKEQPHAE